MKNEIQDLCSPADDAIKSSPFLGAKALGDFRFESLALRDFDALGRNSDLGKFVSMRGAEGQVPSRFPSGEDPHRIYVTPDDIIANTRRELQRIDDKSFGAGATLAFSMSVDPFSPRLLRDGATLELLEELLTCTQFRIRVLTKSTAIADRELKDYFRRSKDRFVVGMSFGPQTDEWADHLEIGASPPSARLDALKQLQKAGVDTFVHWSPILPDVLGRGKLEHFVDAMNPSVLEGIWAAPYSEHEHWDQLEGDYASDSAAAQWLLKNLLCAKIGNPSSYALNLYRRFHLKAQREGWLKKLHYQFRAEDIFRDYFEDIQNFTAIDLNPHQ